MQLSADMCVEGILKSVSTPYDPNTLERASDHFPHCEGEEVIKSSSSSVYLLIFP